MLRHISLLCGLLLASLMSLSAQDCVGSIPRSCSLLKGWRAVFVGSLVQSTPKFRFRVDENVKGATDDYFELDQWPSGTHFEMGKQYLVFVDSERLDDGDHLFAHVCGPTRKLDHASALLEQVRAERTGKRDASVYGMLWRTLDPGFWREDFERPLPNVVVTLRSKGRSFKTTTDDHGVYAFEHLPQGTYQTSAELPPNLQVGQTILTEPVPPFELPRGKCYENDITALPTGRIAGTAIGPDGKPVHTASIRLYRAEQRGEGDPYVGGYQGPQGPHGEEWKSFEFGRLAAGDYILVFNNGDQPERDTPFHRTFYPRSSKMQDAEVIHLADGEQISNADIHVGDAAAVREIKVRIAWSGGEPTAWVPVGIVAQGAGTQSWIAEPQRDPFTYAMPLWQGVRYSIQATALCRTTGKEAKTNTVAVDGGDSSISEITLTFDKDWCSAK